MLGVDDADSENPQVFYQTAKANKDKAQADKAMINRRRTVRKYLPHSLTLSLDANIDLIVQSLPLEWEPVTSCLSAQLTSSEPQVSTQRVPLTRWSRLLTTGRAREG